MDTNSDIWYLSYGSNMCELQLKKRIGNFKDKKLLLLCGYELCFNKSDSFGYNSYANIQKKENGLVYGIGYLLSNSQIQKLDIFEGCYHSHYIRESLFCKDINDNIINCQVYIASPLYINNTLRPRKEYVDLLLSAKDILPDEYIKKIKEIADI
jgi:hypothetical protein